MASNCKQPFRIFPFPIWSFSSKFALLNSPLIRHGSRRIEEEPWLFLIANEIFLCQQYLRQTDSKESCSENTKGRALDYHRISRFIFVVSLTRIPMTFSSNSTVLLRTVFRILDKNNISAKNTIREDTMKKHDHGMLRNVGFDRTQYLLRLTD